MTCKDCIHYDVCGFHIDEETSMTVNECGYGFKHKDRYTILPVYIGQTVWTINKWHYFKKVTLHEGRVSMLQQKADKSWKVRISGSYGGDGDYTLDDFNFTVFTDLWAAEAELLRVTEEYQNANE